MEKVYDVIFRKRKVLEYAYIFGIFYSAILPNHQIFFYNFYVQYFIGIFFSIVFFFLIVKQENGISLHRKDIMILLGFILPEIIILLVSYVVILLGNGEYSFGIESYSRALGLCLYFSITIAQVYFAIKFFGAERAVILTFLGYFINYLSLVILTFFNANVGEIVQYFLSPNLAHPNVLLEAHEVGAAMSCFFLYFLLFYKGKGRMVFLIETAVILALSNKRIILFSILLGIIIYYVLVLLERTSKKAKYIYGGFVIICCFVFVWLIKSEWLIQLFNNYGINMMQREKFYLGIAKTYEFSPFYLGHGSGFSSNWMDKNWSTLGVYGMTGTLGLHNDILKYFIDLGFFGLLLYIGNYVINIPRIVSKYIGSKEAIFYLSMMSMQIVTWTMDNVSTYHTYQVAFLIVIFSTFFRNIDNKERRE